MESKSVMLTNLEAFSFFVSLFLS